MTKHSQAGMTVIELLTVIAIVAILAAIAIPSFQEFFEKARLRGASDSVTALIALGRAEAVRQDRQVTVGLQGSTTVWCVGANAAPAPAAEGDAMPAAAACDCTAPANCSVGAVSSADFPGVTVTAVGAATTFNPKLGSTVALANQDFGFRSPNDRFQLDTRITPLGHVRSCRPAAARIIIGYGVCP